MKVKANKALSQHFLFSADICDKIVASGPDIKGRVVVEIGPGHGSLTAAILKRQPQHLFLIEKDHQLASKLAAIYHHHEHVSVIDGDAQKIQIAKLSQQKVFIISNLPYNVGTELLCDWLCNSIGNIAHMTLMLQKEVVERICASKHASNYGRLSILCQFLAKCNKTFDVDAQFFTPPPKVTSSILQVSPFDLNLDEQLFKLFRSIITMAFSSRRKMLRKALIKFLDQQDFKALNIDSSIRPQDLSVQDFWHIAELCHAKILALKDVG